MLYEILKYCRNFFAGEIYEDDYSIVSGTISLPFIKSGQYFLVEYSSFNDGVHKAGDELQDEDFHGFITPLNIPKDFLQLVSDIETWQKTNAEAVSSPYKSESFGGYSYTKSDKAVSWQTQFADRLKVWRKI